MRPTALASGLMSHPHQDMEPLLPFAGRPAVSWRGCDPRSTQAPTPRSSAIVAVAAPHGVAAGLLDDHGLAGIQNN